MTTQTMRPSEPNPPVNVRAPSPERFPIWAITLVKLMLLAVLWAPFVWMEATSGVPLPGFAGGLAVVLILVGKMTSVTSFWVAFGGAWLLLIGLSAATLLTKNRWHVTFLFVILGLLLLLNLFGMSLAVGIGALSA